MNYKDTLDYLFDKTPMFQQRGAIAYKPGLEITQALDNYYNNPHKAYKTIHVAGTNGKGSVSHTIAAILQSSGYKVGLFTSPHLIDFSERIRVDGETIKEDFVIEFVEKSKNMIEELKPSFFELTTIMAFEYFKIQKVDIAIIETGMGGRMDSTNIINPLLSIITNISLDHTQFLGNTIYEIAWHKAGIIKRKIPVVIGRKDITSKVFIDESIKKDSQIYFAEDCIKDFSSSYDTDKNYLIHICKEFGSIKGELTGFVQKENARTILSAISILNKILLNIDSRAVYNGFAKVKELTGLMGRWQKVADIPFTICDTAHNEDGIKNIVSQLEEMKFDRLHIIFGMVSDKDINKSLSLLPKYPYYYCTQASIKRAKPYDELCAIARGLGLKANAFPSVELAYKEAKTKARPNDVILVIGSTFVVADFLKLIK